jgi:hypothetical protein
MRSAAGLPGAATSITVHLLACSVSPAELATDGNADTIGVSATAIAARPETHKTRVIFFIFRCLPDEPTKEPSLLATRARESHTPNQISCAVVV